MLIANRQIINCFLFNIAIVLESGTVQRNQVIKSGNTALDISVTRFTDKVHVLVSFLVHLRRVLVNMCLVVTQEDVFVAHLHRGALRSFCLQVRCDLQGRRKETE